MLITAIKAVTSECVTPAVINGRILNVDGVLYKTGDVVEEAEAVSVTCDQKFFLDLNKPIENVIKCLEGKWNKKFPECFGKLLNFKTTPIKKLKSGFLFLDFSHE